MSLSVAIQHRYPDFTLDVAFSAPPGLTALFGRSGSGKTSVINAVAGLLQPDHAQIVLDGTTLNGDGRPMKPHLRNIGYVFQDARLFPHMTVGQNLTYAGFIRRRKTPDLAKVVDLLGLGHLLDRRPGTLSGGEKQRVAIGRALLSEPKLLLMDEPLAALDEARKAEILPYIAALRDQTGLPILYVSHSLAETAGLATTIVVLDAGRVRAAGPAADILADPELAPHLGLRDAGAVLTAKLIAQDADGLTRLDTGSGSIWLPRVSGAPGQTLRIRIAARDVILARNRPEGLSALNILPVVVTALRQGPGAGVLVQLELGEQRLLARVTRRSADDLGLRPDLPLFAIVKSVSVAHGDIFSAPETT